MPTVKPAHPRPWHKGSIFGDGPRLKLDRERRAVWKARIEIHRRAGRITDGFAHVGRALLKRLGEDGRCDPGHATLAEDSGESERTVRRALDAFRELGMVGWARRILRAGWRAVQTSNAYMLTLGEPPKIPLPRCNGQIDRETLQEDFVSMRLTVSTASEADRTEAIAALARVREARLLGKGARLVP